MITKINEIWTITIPVFSFITVFSSAFLNRQKQISYVTNTALFNDKLTVDLSTFSKFTYHYLPKDSKKLKICFIAPDCVDWTTLNGDLPLNFSLHNIEFVFATITDISVFLRNGLTFHSEWLFIFCGFNNWHTIIATIHSSSLEGSPSNEGIVISGGDTSKRHLVSPMSIKLHTFLFLLAGFDITFLVNNIVFNIDKKLLTPQFNFQEFHHPTGISSLKRMETVDKNKRNNNNRNLYTDFAATAQENLSNDINESVGDQSKAN